MNEYKVRDLLTIKNGKDHKHLGDGKYPVYGSGGIMRYVDSYLYDKPSILLPRKGTLDNIQYCDTPFWCVDTTYYSEVNTSLANPYYLYRYLSILNLKGLDSGTALPSMTFDSYYQIKVSLPNIEMQNRIGNALYQIDQKIALNSRMNAELEAMAKQLYDYWFVQFDFPDENGNPYKSSGGKMVYNSTLKREIPAGWEVSNYGNEFDVKLGGTPSTSEDSFWKDGTINWLNSGEVQNFPINSSEKKITESALNGSSTEFLPKGSVLISITRYLRVTILNIDACINQSVAGFAETDILKYPYSYFALSAEVPRLIKLRTGAQQPHINKEIIEASPILLPPKRILREYYASCSPTIDILFKKSEEIEELTHLRDSLLPMLMNGQVIV